MLLSKCTGEKIANVLGDLLEFLWYLSAKDASAIMTPSIAHVFRIKKGFACILEMSRNVQSGNTQNLKSSAASNQAAVCACAHSRYFTGGSPSGLRV